MYKTAIMDHLSHIVVKMIAYANVLKGFSTGLWGHEEVKLVAVTETNIYSRQTSVLPTFKHLNKSSNSLQGKFLGLFGTLNILSMIRKEKKF